MEKSSESILSSKKSRDQELNRRELLKILAASGGGLVAAAFLPGKWMKPIVEAGVLPAHAQATDTLRITQLYVARAPDRSKQSNTCLETGFYGSATYQDDYCQVSNSSLLVGSCPTLSNWGAGYPYGNSCSGHFDFEFEACCNQVLSIYLQVGSRQSATATANLPCESA
jgi:hypothetical protein